MPGTFARYRSARHCNKCVPDAPGGGTPPYARFVGRTPRTELPDGYFHAFSRGTGPMEIYRDADDFRTFERMLKAVARRFAWTVYAYCLMPTHYHLIVEARMERLSRGMHRLNGRYAKYFNKRHERKGALFQGRYHLRVVDSDEHLQRLGDYVPDNPVRAGLCNERAEWPFSWSAFDA